MLFHLNWPSKSVSDGPARWLIGTRFKNRAIHTDAGNHQVCRLGCFESSPVQRPSLQAFLERAHWQPLRAVHNANLSKAGSYLRGEGKGAQPQHTGLCPAVLEMSMPHCWLKACPAGSACRRWCLVVQGPWGCPAASDPVKAHAHLILNRGGQTELLTG